MSSDNAGIDADQARSYSSIERVAQDVRDAFGLKLREPIDFRKLFEFDLNELSIQTATETIPVVSAVENIEQEAQAKWNPEQKRLELVLSEKSYNDLDQGRPRSRFAIAHELGHIVMHSSKLIKLVSLDDQAIAALYRGRKDHPRYRDTEWQANAFSAAFLAPAKAIVLLKEKLKRMPSVEEIAAEFSVSFECAAYRLDNLKKVSM